MKGGGRAPAPEPDDDADGLVDEDRLDGIDNDRDGLVDEDFAAIGDEMIVTAYSAGDPSSSYRLDFHQESYAWSLRNIDSAIMHSLIVKNAGEETLTNVRVAVYYVRTGYFELTETVVEISTGGGATRAVEGVALTSFDNRCSRHRSRNPRILPVASGPIGPSHRLDNGARPIVIF